MNTNEAAFNRAISNVSEEDVNLEDIDLSPTGILLRVYRKSLSGSSNMKNMLMIMGKKDQGLYVTVKESCIKQRGCCGKETYF